MSAMDDHDRIITLESQVRDLSNRYGKLEKDQAELQASAQMGKGAWAFIVRLGSVLVVIAGAFAWLWDRIGSKHP